MDSTKILWVSPYGMLLEEINELRKLYSSIEIFTLASHPNFFFEILRSANQNNCNVIAYTNIHPVIEKALIEKSDDSIVILKSYRTYRFTGNRFYDSLTEEYVDEVIPVHLYWKNVKLNRKEVI